MACWPCRSWPLKTSRAKCGGQDRMGITTLHGHCIELADIAAIPKGERERKEARTHTSHCHPHTRERWSLVRILVLRSTQCAWIRYRCCHLQF